jgi:uncharacterized protein YbjT (DUF2867 family)
MVKPKILVTGATGNTGRVVVDELLAKGFPVRALVRRRDARSAAIEQKGAEIVVADMFDPDQLLGALRGARRAYYLPMIDPYMAQSATAFALAAREVKLEAIVQLSQWLSHRAHPSQMTRATWLVDQLFAMLPGISHTIVNPGMFADNFLRVMDFPALLGIYPVLMGPSRCAPVSNEDIGRVAAAVLAAPERHSGMRYRPTGPELMTGRDMAKVIAKVVGHPVVAVDLPFWMFSKVARMRRVDPFLIGSLRDYIRDNKAGGFAFEGGVNDVVEELTGVSAESFESTARRYAAAPFAQITLRNRLKALGRFMATPFWPGYDIDKLNRRWGFPVPPNPSLSIDDERWRAEHSLQNARQSAPKPVALMHAV